MAAELLSPTLTPTLRPTLTFLHVNQPLDRFLPRHAGGNQSRPYEKQIVPGPYGMDRA